MPAQISHASSGFDLYLTYHQLSANEASSIAGVSAGAYEVSVNIKNNPGFAAFGLGFSTNNFNICRYNGTAVTTDMYCSVESAITNNYVAFTFARGKDVTQDGTLFKFYVTKTTSGTASITVTANNVSSSSGKDIVSNAPVIVNDSTSNFKSYVCGDSNNDKVVNSKDSVIILQALDRNNGNSISESLFYTKRYQWFPDAQTLHQVDVDLNNRITKADSNEILKYYASQMLHSSYNGEVGKTFYYTK